MIPQEFDGRYYAVVVVSGRGLHVHARAAHTSIVRWNRIRNTTVPARYCNSLFPVRAESSESSFSYGKRIRHTSTLRHNDFEGRIHGAASVFPTFNRIPNNVFQGTQYNINIHVNLKLISHNYNVSNGS